ncbi:hypothetical protein DFQ28_000280 [Apophysomyces sp. BC1034]|nr:hypothetical protein DFQ30_008115 [Apophysomyces sp. BC1015]KAG0182249.1 hypothetical protein DFQ29_005132 [Apophysomyces sp. BC1021]KAG0191394.1 hypothetical protein DFQ28_000280 [Apophysomyces sp. BC1034]
MVKLYSVISALAIFGFVGVQAGILHDLIHHHDKDDHHDRDDHHDGDHWEDHWEDEHWQDNTLWGPPEFSPPDVNPPQARPKWACMCFDDKNTDKLCSRAGGEFGQLEGNHICIVSEYSYSGFNRHCGGANCQQLGG